MRAAVGKRVLELADKKIKTELYYIGSRDGKRGFDDDKSRALDDWLNQCRGKTGPLGGKEYEPVDYWRGTIHGEDARGGNSAGGKR